MLRPSGKGLTFPKRLQEIGRRMRVPCFRNGSNGDGDRHILIFYRDNVRTRVRSCFVWVVRRTGAVSEDIF
jgi:hypothetical protein